MGLEMDSWDGQVVLGRCVVYFILAGALIKAGSREDIKLWKLLKLNKRCASSSAFVWAQSELSSCGGK